MQAKTPEVEFLDYIQVQEGNKISSLLVYILHETRNLAFSRRSRAKTAKKMYKKSVLHVQNCCFAWYQLLCLYLLVAVPSLNFLA